MNSTIVLLAGGVFLFGVVAYVMFMVFLPEWVGITGKKAREAQEAHRGTQASGPDLLGRMQGEAENKSKNKAEDKP
jgi:hypothetical protein